MKQDSRTNSIYFAVSFILLGSASTFSQTSFGSEPAKPVSVHHVSGAVQASWISKGHFLGGSRGVKQAKIQGLRRGPQSGGERWVFDFDGRDSQVPFFEAALELVKGESRMVVSFWGQLSHGIDEKALEHLCQKSPLIHTVEFLPQVEEGVAVVVFRFKKQSPLAVRSMVLEHPGRLVFDFKPAGE